MANVGTTRIYQDFEPATTWTSEPGAEVLVADLPGFRKEQLKVLVTSTRKLRLTGERPTGGNKWIRFRKEFLLPPNVDADSISAMFKDGKLYVRHPKTRAQTPPEPPVARPRNQDETKQEHGSKQVAEERKPEKEVIEQRIGGKTDQMKPNEDIKQKAREVKDAKQESSESKASMNATDKDEAKWLEKYKDTATSTVKEAKNKRQMLCNLVAVSLLILLMLLYARNAARYSLIGESQE